MVEDICVFRRGSKMQIKKVSQVSTDEIQGVFG